MHHIHPEFGFEIAFVLSGNSSVTLPYTRDKGALPRQRILGQNCINTYKYIFGRDSENVITYNGGGVWWSANPKKTSLFVKF